MIVVDVSKINYDKEYVYSSLRVDGCRSRDVKTVYKLYKSETLFQTKKTIAILKDTILEHKTFNDY